MYRDYPDAFSSIKFCLKRIIEKQHSMLFHELICIFYLILYFFIINLPEINMTMLLSLKYVEKYKTMIKYFCH